MALYQLPNATLVQGSQSDVLSYLFQQLSQSTSTFIFTISTSFLKILPNGNFILLNANLHAIQETTIQTRKDTLMSNLILVNNSQILEHQLLL
jgi:hypothetical protein